MQAVVAALKKPGASASQAGKSTPDGPDPFQFAGTTDNSLPPATTAIDRYLDLSLLRITVVRKREAIKAIRKLVEFRSPRQRIAFVPGVYLLFSQNAAERKRGGTGGCARDCHTDNLSGLCALPIDHGGCRAMHFFQDLILIPGCRIVWQGKRRGSRARWRSTSSTKGSGSLGLPSSWTGR